jgi:hypothetical protein
MCTGFTFMYCLLLSPNSCTCMTLPIHVSVLMKFKFTCMVHAWNFHFISCLFLRPSLYACMRLSFHVYVCCYIQFMCTCFGFTILANFFCRPQSVFFRRMITHVYTFYTCMHACVCVYSNTFRSAVLRVRVFMLVYMDWMISYLCNGFWNKFIWKDVINAHNLGGMLVGVCRYTCLYELHDVTWFVPVFETIASCEHMVNAHKVDVLTYVHQYVRMYAFISQFGACAHSCHVQRGIPLYMRTGEFCVCAWTASCVGTCNCERWRDRWLIVKDPTVNSYWYMHTETQTCAHKTSTHIL